MQKEIWQKEYKSLKNVPSSRRMRPSKVAVWLIKEFVSKKKIIPGKALDIGSGKGRNAIYLAKNGYEVVGIEIVEEAITFAKKEAKKKKVEGKVKFIKQNVGKKLVFKDKSFDLILDIWTMHLLNSKEREIYIKEIIRLLKPNGFFLFATMAADSKGAKELLKSSPGPEPKTYIISQTGVIERPFTEKELKSIFSPLKMFHLEKKKELVSAWGERYERVYYFGLMIKP